MKHYRDLSFVLLLAIVSIIWMMTPSLKVDPFNIIPYAFLILFLTGYPLLACLKPLVYEMEMLKRSILTVNLSLIITIVALLVSSYTALKSLDVPLYLLLAYISIIITIVAFIRRSIVPDKEKAPISPETAASDESPGLYIPEDVDEKNLAIRVEQVSMAFNLSQEKVDNLKEYVIKLVKRELFYQEFWALKDVSFYVEKGEKIGIIGLNGAGKSTLLKLVSGVMKPTEGNIKVNGGIVPLIELGGGFDNDYTGRENIYLRGTLLGYSREFMESKYDEIVEFSGLEDFIDVPVKNYSSGMVSRLGFSISTVVHPQILILDEVLSVGDAAFQDKSMKRMNSFLNEDVTVILVSHRVEQIKNLCSRAIWLEKGKVVMQGDATEVSDSFLESLHLED